MLDLLMQEESFTEEEVLRALHIAGNYLDGAEDVLWTAAEQADSAAHTNELESATQAVWDAQHELMDLQRKLGGDTYDHR